MMTRLLQAALRIALFAAPLVAQQTVPKTQRDVLAGKITGPNGPVQGATITVLDAGAPLGTFGQTARTDAEGRWLAAVQEGSGDYVIRVKAIGMLQKETSAKRGEPFKPIIV